MAMVDEEVVEVVMAEVVAMVEEKSEEVMVQVVVVQLKVAAAGMPRGVVQEVAGERDGDDG